MIKPYFFIYTFIALCGLLSACSDAGNSPTPQSTLLASPATYTLTPPPTITTIAQQPTPPLPTPTTPSPLPPTPSHTPYPYPAPPERGDTIYMPIVSGGDLPTATPTPSRTPTITPSPTPTIDFALVRAQLAANGQDLAFSKIGFHTGFGGNINGLEDWMRALDTAGIPFFLKTADDPGLLPLAQQLMQASGLPHTLVYRRSGNQYDTPKYDLSPQDAALAHWQLHKDAFPPSLNPSLVWRETINEVDKTRADWLAQFALHTAQIALDEGVRWAAFGWSSGEPEPQDWESPAMLQFLRLAGNHPDQIAIALHEYSYDRNNIADGYPYKVGRFQFLFEIADKHNIPRPTILITEWGWEYQNVPHSQLALQDIQWAASLYAPYPQIRGAAIWYLGGEYAGIADQAQRLITPLRHYTLGNYFPISPQTLPINPAQHAP